MDIISALGVDSTLGIQFAIFLFAYLFLTGLVFRPYHRAFEERVKRTEGNTEIAERILAESRQLEGEYEQKARALNNETKLIFDRERSLAMKEYDRTVSQAREKAKSAIERNRGTIKLEVERVRKEMKAEIPLLADGIVQKLIGMEMKK